MYKANFKKTVAGRDHSREIPISVIRRLPKYLTYVKTLRERNAEWTLSRDMACAMGLTDVTVRRDLSHLQDFSGIQKRGYETKTLEKILRKSVGNDGIVKVVVIGAGSLGCSLAINNGLSQYGFEIYAIFDSNSNVVGKKCGQFCVRKLDELKEIVSSSKIDIGIIAVSEENAQNAANTLMAAGVRGVLNLTCTNILVGRGVKLIDASIITDLLELSCMMRMA